MIHEELMAKIEKHSERLDRLLNMLDNENNLDLCSIIIGIMIQEAKALNQLETVNEGLYLVEAI